jgi:hypothetical protein
LSCFKRIKETLHPGFFTGRRVPFKDSLLRRGIDLFDHIFKRRLSLANFLFPGQYQKFFGAGSYRAFYRLIPNPALFTLPVALFSGTAFFCQRNPPLLKSNFPLGAVKLRFFNGICPETRVPKQIYSLRALFKIRRTPLKPFAFITFGYILDFPVFKQSLHLDFAAAGTKEFLGGT